MSTQKTKPAVQLVLGSQAITFPLPITVKKLDGSEATVTFTCKALRKSQWAQVRDDHQKTIFQRLADRATEAQPTTLQERIERVEAHGVHSSVAQSLQSDAGLILQFVTAWDLAEDLSADTLQLLEDEFGGTFAKLLEAFETAIYQGRLGN